MLKMPQQEYIKFLRESEGLSVSDIARQVGIHWRTAKRYADQSNWNEPFSKRKSSSPVMGPYMEIVDTWLEEDQLLPRKQRHTGVRIFQRLRAEHAFTGGQRTVLSYVKQQKSRMALERAKTYERLEHPPGEAQVDFTTIQVSRDQELMTYKARCLLSLQQWVVRISYASGEPRMLPRRDEAVFQGDGRRSSAYLVRQSVGRGRPHREAWRASAHGRLPALLRPLPNRGGVLQSVQRSREGERREQMRLRQTQLGGTASALQEP